MRKNLGIIQLVIDKITLIDVFGARGETDISSILTEEQKSIIKNVDNTKLYLVSINELEDSDGTQTGIRGFAHIIGDSHNRLSLSFDDSSLDTNIGINIYYKSGSDKYYIYS